MNVVVVAYRRAAVHCNLQTSYIVDGGAVRGVDRDMFHRLIDGGRVEALYSTPLSLARARLRIRDAGCTPLERTRRR